MSIYTSHLASIPFKSELYLSRYNKFIESCLEKNVDLPPDVYTEEHHILPKADSMFPQFINLRQHPWNAARLTARQHLIAHLMLWKAYDNDAMIHAAQMMANFHGARIGSRLYEKLRKAHAAAMRTLLTGRTLSEETRKKISDAQKGKPRKPFSEETRKKISDAQKGKPRKPFSEEHRKKLSKAGKGKPRKPFSDETKNKMSISNKGQNNYRFKGFYQTPFGIFESAFAAAKASSGAISKNAISNWCKKDNLKVISNGTYAQSPFLQDNYEREKVVGKKTFNDLGFSFISK